MVRPPPGVSSASSVPPIASVRPRGHREPKTTGAVRLRIDATSAAGARCSRAERCSLPGERRRGRPCAARWVSLGPGVPERLAGRPLADGQDECVRQGSDKLPVPIMVVVLVRLRGGEPRDHEPHGQRQSAARAAVDPGRDVDRRLARRLLRRFPWLHLLSIPGCRCPAGHRAGTVAGYRVAATGRRRGANRSRTSGRRQASIPGAASLMTKSRIRARMS